MKILTESTAFDLQTIGGVSRYNYELHLELKKQRVEIIRPFKYSNNAYLKGVFDKHHPIWSKKLIKQDRTRNLWLKYKLFRSTYLENLQSSIHYIQKGDFDIFHPSYYCSYYLKYLKGKPLVVTVHDMTHELYPNYFKKYDDTAKVKQSLISKANHIIAISNNTKKDLIALYDINPNKISVIHHGCSLNSKIYEGERTNHFKYFLYVGSREGYKQFWFTIKALKVILKRYNIKFLCIGRSFDRTEIKRIKGLNLRDHLFTKKCSDEQLVSIYKNALGLIYPSLYEGFGLPILEAFNCDCPVLSSSHSCLPEVGQDAALYFNPLDQTDIQDKTRRFIENKALRIDLIKRGRKIAKQYSWARTAAETINVYNKLISL